MLKLTIKFKKGIAMEVMASALFMFLVITSQLLAKLSHFSFCVHHVNILKHHKWIILVLRERLLHIIADVFTPDPARDNFEVNTCTPDHEIFVNAVACPSSSRHVTWPSAVIWFPGKALQFDLWQGYYQCTHTKGHCVRSDVSVIDISYLESPSVELIE